MASSNELCRHRDEIPDRKGRQAVISGLKALERILLLYRNQDSFSCVQ
jgi:hypothetical protein